LKQNCSQGKLRSPGIKCNHYSVFLIMC